MEKTTKYNAINIAEWVLNENRKNMLFEDSEYMDKMNTPLFNDDFLAWEHGLVIREVYDKYKQNGSYGIKYEKDFTENIDENDEKLIRKIFYNTINLVLGI